MLVHNAVFYLHPLDPTENRNELLSEIEDNIPVVEKGDLIRLNKDFNYLE